MGRRPVLPSVRQLSLHLQQEAEAAMPEVRTDTMRMPQGTARAMPRVRTSAMHLPRSRRKEEGCHRGVAERRAKVGTIHEMGREGAVWRRTDRR